MTLSSTTAVGMSRPAALHPRPGRARACVQDRLSAEPRDALPLQTATTGKFSRSHRERAVPSLLQGSFRCVGSCRTSQPSSAPSVPGPPSPVTKPALSLSRPLPAHRRAGLSPPTTWHTHSAPHRYPARFPLQLLPRRGIHLSACRHRA